MLKSTNKTNGSPSRGRAPPPDSALTCVFFQLTCVSLHSEPPPAYCNLASICPAPISPNPAASALWLYVTYCCHGIWHCWPLARLPGALPAWPDPTRSFTGHAAFLLPFSSLVILKLPPISPESLSLADAGLNYRILISSSNFYPELQTPKSSCLPALSA